MAARIIGPVAPRDWLRDPADELREILRDIGHSHVSSEFIEALLEDAPCVRDTTDAELANG